MQIFDPCDMCGNEFDRFELCCPYCATTRSSLSERVPGALHRRINLEKGMPLVAQALRKLVSELDNARLQGYRVVTLIHGYGSSGKGGAIKEEVRKELEYMVHRDQIKEFLPGEYLGKKHGRYRQLLSRFPGLKQEKELERSNQGITVVIL